MAREWPLATACPYRSPLPGGEQTVCKANLNSPVDRLESSERTDCPRFALMPQAKLQIPAAPLPFIMRKG